MLWGVSIVMLFSVFSRVRSFETKTHLQKTLFGMINLSLPEIFNSIKRRTFSNQKKTSKLVYHETKPSVEEIRSQSNSFGEDFPTRSWKKKKLRKGRDGRPFKRYLFYYFNSSKTMQLIGINWQQIEQSKYFSGIAFRFCSLLFWVKLVMKMKIYNKAPMPFNKKIRWSDIISATFWFSSWE